MKRSRCSKQILEQRAFAGSSLRNCRDESASVLIIFASGALYRHAIAIARPAVQALASAAFFGEGSFLFDEEIDLPSP